MWARVGHMVLWWQFDINLSPLYPGVLSAAYDEVLFNLVLLCVGFKLTFD